jgi:hypothetical protein
MDCSRDLLHYKSYLWIFSFEKNRDRFNVAGELVDSVLGDVVTDMAKEVVCEVCFEEDVPDVWELQCRGSA